jgi:hypothetical protein
MKQTQVDSAGEREHLQKWRWGLLIQEAEQLAIAIPLATLQWAQS